MDSKFLLSFDIEEFDLPEEFQVPVPDKPRNDISAAGTRRILDVVNTARVKATFFVTGYFAERNPELIEEMCCNGHEVASHGMNHSFFEKEHLAASKKLLEKMTGTEVIGFRMARLAKVSKEDIRDAGYVYESSLNPVWLPGRYQNFTKPLLPFQEPCGLWQFPISAVPGIRFPLFWLSFKNLPLHLYSRLCRLAAGMTGYFNMYSHPWEYAEEAGDPSWEIPGYIVKHAGSEQAARLQYLLEYLKQYGKFMTFKEFINGKKD